MSVFMRLVVLPAIVAVLITSAAIAKITFSGGDGGSFEAAIVIDGAEGENDGVASEYGWLRVNRAGGKMVSQSLAQQNGKVYDVMTIDRDGKREVIYFDISDFFGK